MWGAVFFSALILCSPACLPALACVPTSRFGTSEFDAVGVNAFYSFWTTFSTFKSFSWADLYNPASAPNRWIGQSHALLSDREISLGPHASPTKPV